MSSIVDKLELSAAITSNENKSNDDNDVKLNINTEETKNQRLGLTTQDAEDAYKTWGYNELPCVVIPLWYVFMRQFTGVMPYTMEICVLVAAGCQSWPDFGIIIAMVGKLFTILSKLNINMRFNCYIYMHAFLIFYKFQCVLVNY